LCFGAIKNGTAGISCRADGIVDGNEPTAAYRLREFWGEYLYPGPNGHLTVPLPASTLASFLTIDEALANRLPRQNRMILTASSALSKPTFAAG
jgi:hypothetical protein